MGAGKFLSGSLACPLDHKTCLNLFWNRLRSRQVTYGTQRRVESILCMIMCIELSATTCPTSSGSLVSRRKIIGNQGRISKPTFNLFQTLWLADHKLFLALSRIVRSDFWKPVCLILDQHKDSNFSLELWDKSVGNRSRDISTQVVNISSTTYISSCNCVKLHLLLLSFFS